MANAISNERSLLTRPSRQTLAGESSLPRIAQYGMVLVLVAAAAFLAFVASSVVPAPALTLIFVLPVIISGTVFGLGPSVAATLASVLAFDFFFTQPYLTLRMTEPSEIWAAALLLITAGIVSTVSWQSRRHALDARQAAEEANELRGLAHMVIAREPQAQIVEAAAAALSRIFGASAAIYSKSDGGLRVEAAAGSADLTLAEAQAAEAALASGLRIRGRTYPREESRFEMWPVENTERFQYVIAIDSGNEGDDWPTDADRIVEMVAGYIAVNRLKATG